MKTFVSFALLLGTAQMVSAAPVPANRLPPAGYWNPGCIGANGQTYRQSGTFIPPVNLTKIINVKNPPYNAVGDGIHDDTTNIQYAISQGDNAVIYLPAGKYLITAALELANPNWPWQWASKILRGDGMTNTFILGAGGGPFIDASTTNPNEYRQVAQSAPRGSTTITVSSWDNYYDTQNWGILYVPNNLAGAPWITAQPYEANAKCQLVHIIARNSAARTLTFDTPLYCDADTNTTFGIYYGSDSSAGVENLCVSNITGSVTHNINFGSMFNSWVRGVESVNARKWHIRFAGCGRCDIIDCYVHGYYPAPGVGGGDSVYGAGLYGGSSDNLVINNFFDRCRHSLIVEYGDIGNVFAYNYCQNAINEGQEATDYLMEVMDQHGLTAWNLWEGNVGGKFSMDNSLGGSWGNMSFRNNLTRVGVPAVQYGRWGYDIQTSNYWVSVIGSILQSVGYHPSWRVGAPNANGDYPSTGFPIPAPPADPALTLYLDGNVDLESNLPPVWAGADHTLPPSLFLTSAPAFFQGAGIAWPPIGPDVSGYANSLPAQNIVPAASGAGGGATPSTNSPTGSNTVPTPPTQLKANLLK